MRKKFKRGDIIKLTDKAKLSEKYKDFEYKEDLYLIIACTKYGYYSTRNIKTNRFQIFYPDSVELLNPIFIPLI